MLLTQVRGASVNGIVLASIQAVIPASYVSSSLTVLSCVHAEVKVSN